MGQLQTNCYLVSCPKTKEAAVIDPGDDGDFIIRRISDLGLKPKLILATHGHFDHVLAVVELKLAFNIPFLVHKKDLFLLERLRKTAEYFLGYDACPEAADSSVLLREHLRGVPQAQHHLGGGELGGFSSVVGLAESVDRFVGEGSTILFGNEKLRVIETPGHTPGSICLTHSGSGRRNSSGVESSGILFSGDTLFHQGVGRTDFSYASPEGLTKSLQKLFKLPNRTVVYPGHGPETTIGVERGRNFCPRNFLID